VDLNDLVTRMSQLLHVSISKKVELRYDLARSLPAIQGDPVQLQQVVMNLITNAAESIGDEVGTITLATTVVRHDGAGSEAGPLESLPTGDYVRVTVADSGAGMDEVTLRRIFEPFFTTKFTGRGLGLAAVQGIVRGHRGDLAVRSTIGVGSTFTVYLPAAAGAVPGPGRGSASAAEPRGTGTVLVVDDEEIVRGLAERALIRGGYRVLLAKDGAEAVTVFVDAAKEIDVVVLDLTMPVMDGREVLEALRRIDPAVRVVLSSGFTEHDLSARGDVRDTLFLQKPYRPAQLVERVRELLTRA
jgi:CheY-like chemotaxis protein